MIESHSLTKRYGDRSAVQDVSFTCDAGTVTGFLGPNGAGKSTTLKMLCGLTPPSSGGSTVRGSPFAKRKMSSGPVAGKTLFIPRSVMACM